MSQKMLLASLFTLSVIVGCAGSETKPAPAAPAAAPSKTAAKSDAKKESKKEAKKEVKAPEVIVPEEPASKKVTKQVTAATTEWAAAWQARDAEKYLAAYSPDFKPEKGKRDAWEKKRKDRLAKAKNIEVTVSDLVVTSPADDRAHASFTQVYKSDSHSDTDKKILELQKVDGKWLITREYTP